MQNSPYLLPKITLCGNSLCHLCSRLPQFKFWKNNKHEPCISFPVKILPYKWPELTLVLFPASDLSKTDTELYELGGFFFFFILIEMRIISLLGKSLTLYDNIPNVQ